MGTMEILAKLKLNGQNFTSELQREMDAAEKKMSGSGRVIGRNIKENIGDSLRDSAEQIPVIGRFLVGLSGPALVAAGAVGAITAALAVGVGEAAALDKALRQLDVAISRENRTGLSRKELVDFSAEIEGSFAIAQEEVLNAMRVLAQFDGVAGNTFRQAIELSGDLAATEGDLASESAKLGTVLQNLANGDVEGLRKGYKMLGTDTLETIEKLAKLGKTAEAQQALLDELRKTVGGQGRTNAQSLSGAIFLAKDAMGDMTREMSNQIGLLPALIRGFERYAGFFNGIARTKSNSELASDAGLRAAAERNSIERIQRGDDPQYRNHPNKESLIAYHRAREQKAEAEFRKYQALARQEMDEAMAANAEARRLAKDSKDRNARDLAEEEAKKGIRLLPPVDGPTSSGFGLRRRPKAGASAYHPAIDYAVPVGTPVRAGSDGVVIRTGRMGGFGNVVIIDYGNNIEAQFSHLSAALVKPGDVVTRGQVVARTGNTGTSTGPHLDYRVKDGGSYVDPRNRPFKVGEGVGNAYASFEQRAATEREAAEKKAAERQQALEKFLATSREQLDVDIEDFRYVGLRSQGLERQAVIEEEIVNLRRRSVEQIAGLPKDQAENQAKVSDELKAQVSAYEKQAAVLAQLVEANGDRATRTREEIAAEEAAHQATLDALTAAKALAKTAAERLAIEEAIVRAKHAINNAVEDGTKAEKEATEARREAMEKWIEEETKAREEALDLQREQYQDLADFYERAMRSGGKSIVEDFKDQMLSAVASIAAQWTMALLSGQKASFGSLLQQMGATTNGGGFNPLSMFGIGGGNGPGLPGFGGGTFTPGSGGASAAASGGLWDNLANQIGAPQGGSGAAAGFGSTIPMVGAALMATSMISKALGIKNQAGGIFGIGGNLLIGALTPSKRGSATAGLDAYGELTVGSTRGNSSKRVDAASEALGQGIDMLNRIAEALGGSISGRPSGSLGMRDKSWRFDPTGRGITKTKNGAIDFGDDLEAAVRAFVKDGLQDGLIDGLTAAQKKILASGQDLEKAIQKAALIGDLPRRLAAKMDPVGAALDEFHKGWEETLAALREGGATAEEMADAHKLYKIELEDVKGSVQNAAAGLKDFLNSFNFGSASPFALRDQERLARESLQPYLDKIGSGERIDQDKYQEAARGFLEVEREIYGSTGKYFESLDMIMAATGKAIAEIDKATPIRTFADPFIEKTASNTEAIANMSDQMNERLASIESLLGRVLTPGGGSDFTGGAWGFTANSVKA